MDSPALRTSPCCHRTSGQRDNILRRHKNIEKSGITTCITSVARLWTPRVRPRRNHEFHGDFFSREKTCGTPLVAAITRQKCRYATEAIDKQTNEQTDRSTASSRKAPVLWREFNKQVRSINDGRDDVLPVCSESALAYVHNS